MARVRSKVRAWCSAAVALLVTLSAFADATAPALPPRAANRIILTEKQAQACSGDGEKYVTPPASEVQRLESSLVRALTDAAANHKNGYSRQGAARVLMRMEKDIRFYVGTADGFIHVHGYCTEFIEHTGRTCPPMVADGGSCIWYIRFDVKRGTFDHFSTNGEA
jgi:hypothetical protein